LKSLIAEAEEWEDEQKNKGESALEYKITS
jgi:hypothetical protein